MLCNSQPRRPRVTTAAADAAAVTVLRRRTRGCGREAVVLVEARGRHEHRRRRQPPDHPKAAAQHLHQRQLAKRTQKIWNDDDRLIENSVMTKSSLPNSERRLGSRQRPQQDSGCECHTRLFAAWLSSQKVEFRKLPDLRYRPKVSSYSPEEQQGLVAPKLAVPAYFMVLRRVLRLFGRLCRNSTSNVPHWHLPSRRFESYLSRQLPCSIMLMPNLS